MEFGDIGPCQERWFDVLVVGFCAFLVSLNKVSSLELPGPLAGEYFLRISKGRFSRELMVTVLVGEKWLWGLQSLKLYRASSRTPRGCAQPYGFGPSKRGFGAPKIHPSVKTQPTGTPTKTWGGTNYFSGYRDTCRYKFGHALQGQKETTMANLIATAGI